MRKQDNDGRRATVAQVQRLEERGLRLNGDAVAILIDYENRPDYICECLTERCECGARERGKNAAINR